MCQALLSLGRGLLFLVLYYTESGTDRGRREREGEIERDRQRNLYGPFGTDANVEQISRNIVLLEHGGKCAEKR